MTHLRTLLLIDPDKDHVESIINSLVGLYTGAGVDSTEVASDYLNKNKVDYLVYKLENVEDAVFIDQVHENHPDVEIIVCVKQQFHKFLKVFQPRPFLRHFVSLLPNYTVEDVVVTLKKLHSKKIFGLEHYFHGVYPEFEVSISDSHQKESYIQQCLKFFEPLNLTSSLKSRLGNILDELMMNMLWDAPRDEDGNPINNNKERSEHILLTEKQAGLVQIKYDDSHIGISASDPFGALEMEKILSYLTKCFYSEEQIGSEGKGAGLGLYMIYKQSNNFTINVEKGKKTEFLLLFQTKFSRKIQKAEKSFHYYEVK